MEKFKTLQVPEENVEISYKTGSSDGKTIFNSDLKIIVGTIGNDLESDLNTSRENIRVYIFKNGQKESNCFEFSPYPRSNSAGNSYHQSFLKENNNFTFSQTISSPEITQEIKFTSKELAKILP